jgi:hypothetical protein
MHIKRVTAVLMVLAGCLLASCSTDRWTEVKPGEYVAVRGVGVAGEAAAQKIQKIAVDRDKGTATFTLVDGSQFLASFVSRERANWPAGCPSNIGSTRMEVLDIQKDTLIIGSATFDDPILVRNCPPDPVRIALREDGRIGGSGGACSGANECILFGR